MLRCRVVARRLIFASFVCFLAYSLAYIAADGRSTAKEDASTVQYLNAQPGAAYVGDEDCRDCHEPQYRDFKRTGMGRSLSIPGAANWPEFAKPVTLVSKRLGRTYSVYLRNGKMYHAESKRGEDGKLEYIEKHEIAFTVGSGDVGRSYLVAKGDALFLSPISFYSSAKKWDLSPGYEEEQFRGFTRPAGTLCVTCHSGLPQPIVGTRNRYQDPPFRFLPVGCERCHGPGEIHVRQRRANAPLGGPIDSSIVNPSRARQELRNDICNQCHFGADAQVLRPGKSYLDFRPGTPLGTVVSLFTAPVASRSDAVKALSHEEQLELSRCWSASKSRLYCITCHDPHIQRRGVDAAAYFRDKCLTCHTIKSCAALSTRRQATLPPDNCIQCHMPKKSVLNISHSALTDHRILRTGPGSPSADSVEAGPNDNLIYRTPTPDQPDAEPDLRTLALAYYEVSQTHPEYRPKGFELLQQAAHELPNDVEVQAAYGMVLSLARPGLLSEASQALQRAIDAGSKSVEVRTRLAKLRLQEENIELAKKLYGEAITADPYYTPAYFGLADLYLATGDYHSAAKTLERILAYDPSNEEARQALAQIATKRQE